MLSWLSIAIKSTSKFATLLRFLLPVFLLFKIRLIKKLYSVVLDSDFEDDFSDDEPEVQECAIDKDAKNVEENIDGEKNSENSNKDVEKDVTIPKE